VDEASCPESSRAGPSSTFQDVAAGARRGDRVPSRCPPPGA
jgi:hypothetical protein